MLCLWPGGVPVCFGMPRMSVHVLWFTYVKVEFLGMAGAFGVLISGIQTAALEWNTLSEVTWTNDVVLFVIGYSFR